MTKTYSITITEKNGDSNDLIYTQTMPALDVRGVILAVNADAPLEILPIPAPRKRAPRSDRGKARTPKIEAA